MNGLNLAIHALRWAATLMLAAALAGCTQHTASSSGESAVPSHSAGWQNGDPTPDEVARMLEPNVLGVSCFYDPLNPWIWNSQHMQVRGVRINALYLRGPNYTGVFGDGVIRPRLYVLTRDEQGKQEYRLLKEWTFDVNQAMPFRAKRRMTAGWGYALFLDWGDLNLTGRNVRLTINFERTDGVVISGSKKDFRVPKPDNS